jgi:hypothetical protein
MWTNVMSYDCTRSDEATLAESDAANYCRVCADGYSFFDPCFYWYPIRVATPRGQIVSENSVWTKKYVVSNVNVLPHADAVFDRYVITDCDAALDEIVIADVAVRADTDVFQDVSERPDASAFADVIGFDQRLLVNKCLWFYIAHNHIVEVLSVLLPVPL